ncbi:ABC transporter permease [Sphingomonas aracearum]|uniref:ABC transporter permease n=1 Tax=Sphingomonas aracearum TaxID=2283317 RepID=A0A369VUE7_9SPHN|nr:ABC transporter permease [Sphingomonas aracearum]RDE05275.1 ABC transporter permease [Sphingomonas aracearum]
MKRNLALPAGAVLCGVFVIAALVATVWTPYDVADLDIGRRLLAPSPSHWLGTDQYGRDLLSMILAGATVSLSVSLLAVGAALLVGVPLGLLAAARGGWVDALVTRAGDVLFAFPALLLAVLFAAILGPGASNAILAVALFNVPVFARVTRSEARRLWRRDFVAAARLAGKGRARISAEHILPNSAGVLLVQATIQFALAIVAEAGLSYVGLGVQPPLPSWGRMLADAQTLIGVAPRLAIAPGLAIVLAVFGITLLGDGLARRVARDD